MAVASIMDSVCHQIETAMADDAAFQSKLQINKAELLRKKQVHDLNTTLLEAAATTRQKEAWDNHLKRRAELLAALRREDEAWEVERGTMSSEIEQLRRTSDATLRVLDEQLEGLEGDAKARAESQMELAHKMQDVYEKLVVMVKSRHTDVPTDVPSSNSNAPANAGLPAKVLASVQPTAASQLVGGSGSSDPPSSLQQPGLDTSAVWPGKSISTTQPTAPAPFPPDSSPTTVLESAQAQKTIHSPPAVQPTHLDDATSQLTDLGGAPGTENDKSAPRFPDIFHSPSVQPATPNEIMSQSDSLGDAAQMSSDHSSRSCLQDTSSPPSLPPATTSDASSQSSSSGEASKTENNFGRQSCSTDNLVPASPAPVSRGNRPDAFAAETPRSSRPATWPGGQTITLDELERFDEGTGTKHRIFPRHIQGLKAQLSFCILHCDVHRLGFASPTLADAMDHLSKHGGRPEVARDAEAKVFDLFGMRVLDCKQSTMDHYNAELSTTDVDTSQPGPFQADDARVAIPTLRQDVPNISSPSPHGIANPGAGGLYRVRHAEISWLWETVLVMPWQAAADTCLFAQDRLPSCLAYDQSTRSLAWQPNYRDGGGSEALRSFPVLYLSRGVRVPDSPLSPFVPPASSLTCLAWVSARDLLARRPGPAQPQDLGRTVAEGFSRWRQIRATLHPEDSLWQDAPQGMELPLVLTGPEPVVQPKGPVAHMAGQEEAHGAGVVSASASGEMGPPTWKQPPPSPPMVQRRDRVAVAGEQPVQPSSEPLSELRMPVSPPSSRLWTGETSDYLHSTIVVAFPPRPQSHGNAGCAPESSASSSAVDHDVCAPENTGSHCDSSSRKRSSDHLGMDQAFLSQPASKKTRPTYDGGRWSVDYSMVYSDGQPRHRIIRVPAGQYQGAWFIFLCLGHYRHFSRENAYSQMHNHLNTKCARGANPFRRGSMWDTFVSRFGVRVLSCDRQKEEQSNLALAIGVSKGRVNLDAAAETPILELFRSLQGDESPVRSQEPREPPRSIEYGASDGHGARDDGASPTQQTWTPPPPTTKSE